MEELEKNLQQAPYNKSGAPSPSTTLGVNSVEGLSKQERRQLKKQRKQEERKSEQRKQTTKKAVNIALMILIVGGGIFALGWYATSRPSLPPTTTQGHTEDMPQAHATDAPIPDSMQRHMLEHADGKGKAGIIIQYNCKDYACEPDMIQNLKILVEKYPNNVYLAPNNYDGKIILTKLGKLKILENFDEQTIKGFVE